MEKFDTSGVCAKSIEFELDGSIVKSIKFNGGCNGNLKGIATLVEGQEASVVIEKLRGLTCGNKTTSCPDQLALALEEAVINN